MKVVTSSLYPKNPDIARIDIFEEPDQTPLQGRSMEHLQIPEPRKYPRMKILVPRITVDARSSSDGCGASPGPFQLYATLADVQLSKEPDINRLDMKLLT